MKYRHYKGGVYEFITKAEWTGPSIEDVLEEGDLIVFYQSGTRVFARPEWEFDAWVKTPAGDLVRRFTSIDEGDGED